MNPPVQPRPLSAKLIVQLEDALPSWPALIEQNVIGGLRADAGVNAPSPSPAVPDRFYCWSARRNELVALPLVFAPGLRDWNEVWARGLTAAACHA